MAPDDIGTGNLTWEDTLSALVDMMGEQVTVNALCERTGKAVVWITGELTQAPDFDTAFRASNPDWRGSRKRELLLVRVGDPGEGRDAGVMLREEEFQAAGWFPPNSPSAMCLRILQGDTVIQVARFGRR